VLTWVGRGQRETRAVAAERICFTGARLHVRPTTKCWTLGEWDSLTHSLLSPLRRRRRQRRRRLLSLSLLRMLLLLCKQREMCVYAKIFCLFLRRRRQHWLTPQCDLQIVSTRLLHDLALSSHFSFQRFICFSWLRHCCYRIYTGGFHRWNGMNNKWLQCNAIFFCLKV
jgi:hypothetical protein